MEVKALAVEIFIRTAWPKLKGVTPTSIGDSVYTVPSTSEVMDLLRKTWFEKYIYTLNRFDCNRYAQILASFVAQECYKMKLPYLWPFGEIRGYFATIQGGHALNFCYTSDNGMVLIEPQTDGVYRPSPDDEPMAIWM